ncbi:HAMP domain-containing histidine kinase [Streptomyces actuosus]|uniref:histidine kinase n=1 Tax=Streptomyces actuosus TaxID=1885 RepID=A0ABS2VZK7_STRAS|nr:HAMP domain-containing sensor histidine kinase [Streptomyces actuosus]MBN0048582.1 HAMP domain-containing histidine kinase [Streptomyces actuosus]
MPTAAGATTNRSGAGRIRSARKPKPRTLTRVLLAVTAIGVLGTGGCCGLAPPDRPRDHSDQRVGDDRRREHRALPEPHDPPPALRHVPTAPSDAGGEVRVPWVRPGVVATTPRPAPVRATYGGGRFDVPRTAAYAAVRGTGRVAPARPLDDGRPAQSPPAAVDGEPGEQTATSPVVRTELAVGGLVLALLACVVLWCARRTVMPIREMTRNARRIAESSDEASERLPEVRRSARGLQGTADTLNYLLQRIQEGAAQRAQAEHRLHQLVGAASHELRTPLTTITGYTQLARIGALDDPRRLDQAMEQVEREIHRMNQLVEDLLLLARLSQGGLLEQRPVDLARLCADATTRAQPPGTRRSLRCVTESSTHLVEGDRHRLAEVIGHLVANVLAHTPESTSAEVRLRLDGDRQVIDVVDEGPGVPEAARRHVFEPFFRAASTPPAPDGDPSRGRGLGLTVAAAIVKAHGGSIALRPSERGAWFHVTLPALDDRSHADGTTSGARAAVA